MKKTKIFFLIAGVLLLALLFTNFGVKQFTDHILKLGWKFGIILLICLCNNIILTFAWKIVINFPLPKSFFFQLILARIAGDASSSINSMGAVAGEAIKAIFVQDKIPLNIGLASVVLDRTIHTIANIILVLTAISFSFFILELPLLFSISAFAVFIILLIIIIIVLRKQRNGLIAFIISKAPRKIINKIMNDNRWDKVREFDKEIAYIFSNRKNIRKFYISLIIHYLSTIITQSLEIYCIINFIGVNISLIDSLLVYAFGLMLTGIIVFIPANLGISEGSYSLVLGMLGYDPALGLTTGIIRRLRTFVWAGIGITLLFYAGLFKKGKIQYKLNGNE